MSAAFENRKHPRGSLQATLAAGTAPIRWFAAHDVFVTYNRREAFKYAVALANRLGQPPNRLSTAIDHLESLPSPETPARLLRHVRWSRARIVLVTPAALASTEMARELAEIHTYPGPLVLIAQPGVTLEDASWFAHVVGVEPTIETGGPSAFSEGKPSDAVIESVLSVLKFTRRERRISFGAAIGAALTLTGVLAAAHFGESANRSQVLARAAVELAENASSAASAATERADRAASAAASAAEARAQALDAAASASHLAQRETARAGVAQRLAEASTLAVDAANLLELSPTRLDEALLTAKRSVEIAPTLAGNSILRRTTTLMPILRASIESGCEESNPIFKAAQGLLVIGSSPRLCLVDLHRHAVVSRWTTPDDELVSLYDGPDGKVLYVGERIGSLSKPTVLLLDPADSWRVVARLNIRGQISTARFNPLGSQLAIGTEQGAFALVTRHADGRWTQGPFAGSHRSINRLEFDASGKYLLVASETALEVWSGLDAPAPHRHRGEQIREKGLPFLTRSPPLALDASGGQLIAAFNDQVKVLSFPDLNLIQAIAQPEVDALHVSANDRLIVHIDNSGFRAWKRGRDGLFKPHASTSQLRGDLPTSKRLVASADGSHLWTFEVQNADKASWASLRRVHNGQELARIGHATYLRELLPWPEGRAWIAISADATIRIWEEPQDAGSTTHDDLEVQSAAVDASAQRAVISVSDFLGLPPRKIEFWSLEPPMRRRHEIVVRDSVVAMRIGSEVEPVVDVVDDKAWVQHRGWPPKGSSVRAQMPPRANCKERVVAWGDPKMGPATSGGRRELWLWRDESWFRVALPWLIGNCPSALAVDGKMTLAALSSLANEARVDVVDLATGQRHFGFSTPYLVRALAIDATARRMVVGNSDEAKSRFSTGEARIELRRLPDGQVLARAALPGGGLFSTVCISPDGRRIAAEGGAKVHVWEFDQNKATLQLVTVHVVPSVVRFCRFNADASRLAIGDKTGVSLIALEAQELLANANKRRNPSVRSN